jgi:hypothetical protein
MAKAKTEDKIVWECTAVARKGDGEPERRNFMVHACSLQKAAAKAQMVLNADPDTKEFTLDSVSMI